MSHSWEKCWENSFSYQYLLQDQDISSPEGLTEACLASGISQETAAQLVSEIKDSVIKEELKATTNEAVELGVRIV